MKPLTKTQEHYLSIALKGFKEELRTIPSECWDYSFVEAILTQRSGYTVSFLDELVTYCQTDDTKEAIIDHFFQFVDQFDEFSPRICEKIIQKNPSYLSKIDKKARTQALCEQALNRGLELLKETKETKRSQPFYRVNLGSIPKSFRTDDVCEKAVQLDGTNLRFVPNQTPELITLALQNNPSAIKHAKKELLTQEMVEFILSQNGHLIQYLPNEWLTEEIYQLAVQRNGNSIRWIENPSEELCLMAIEQTETAFEYLKNPTHPMILAFLRKNPTALSYHREYWKESYIMTALNRLVEQNKSTDILLTRLYDGGFRDEQVDLFVVQHGLLTPTLFQSYHHLFSPDLLLIALKTYHEENWKPLKEALMTPSFFEQLGWSGKQMKQAERLFKVEDIEPAPIRVRRSKKLIKMALKQQPMFIASVPLSIQTEEIAQLAILKEGLTLRHIRSTHKTYQRCRMAVRLNEEAMMYSPYHV